MKKRALSLFVVPMLLCLHGGFAAEPIQISGVYPSLRMWNSENECGTGALVPWQGNLWAITYAPHMPNGSSDKLYWITPDLKQHIYEGSVGGTPANRMIHRESNQLLIGPYLIDAKKNIRTIPPSAMLGRLTGNARHLVDPENKVYYATMEEGLYSVDVNTLEVENHILDGHAAKSDKGIRTTLLGYHGKGLFSAQGRLVYSNNGDRGPRVKVDPTVESGALAQWFGEGDWELVRRNQFTEVTGPGGIAGNERADTDPLWAMGWDARSLILALLQDKKWTYYRLPKGSHSYDGAHGWNTEWPRIREIGEKDFLATMHGTFWRFPPTFSRENTAGITPRSNYLKVIGDFCRWNDQVVMGCDDSAKAEFLNTRRFKAKHASPVQSNSNLWFVDPAQLDHFGPVIGRGSVWLREELAADQVSDPYLFSGYDYRQLLLVSKSGGRFVLEVDRKGNNEWEVMQSIAVKPGEVFTHVFPKEEKGSWLRLRAEQAASVVSAHFQYRNRDARSEQNPAMFDGIATVKKPAAITGVMRSLSYDRLGVVAGNDFAYYELNPKMELVRVDEPGAAKKLVKEVRQPTRDVYVDDASVMVEEDGKRYRLPRNPAYVNEVVVVPKTLQGKTLKDYLSESLALGAAVTVSSTLRDYAGKYAVDGDMMSDDARWISQDAGQASIDLDFGAEKTFRSVWVCTGWQKDSHYTARDFDVQVKKEGDWVTLPGGSIRGNKLLDREVVLDKSVTAQHLRVIAPVKGLMRVYEIAVFDRVLDIQKPELPGYGPARVCREVATERDLLNLHGTFYELPARNAQGLAKVRPVATHNLAIQDFCSHSGLLFFTGLDAEAESEHIFRSADGQAAVWAGVIDDLWKLGKPRGVGGPWKESKVKAGVPSDPYLMTAYDKKQVELSVRDAATVRLEVDVDGTGLWVPYKSFQLAAGGTESHTFPIGFSAYWVRAVSDADSVATVTFLYE